jgi:hypothetical protein
MSSTHIFPGHRYLCVDIKEGVPHFTIQGDPTTEIFLRNGRAGIEQLNEFIAGLVEIRNVLDVEIPGGLLAEIFLRDGRAGVEQFKKFIAGLVEIRETLYVEHGYKVKVGNGQDTVFTIKHGFHTKNLRVVVFTNFGYETPCVAFRVIDEDTITVGFSPREKPGSGDEQYTVEMFPNG